MKKVNKNFKVKPLSLQATRLPYQKAIRKVIANNGWTNSASKLYTSTSVKKSLNQIYNNKCAYCEQTPVGSPLEIDHFRPKDGVKGITHTGYYWLAYEWSNLLYSCGNCNEAKRNKFPIFYSANRVNTPSLDGRGNIIESNNFILNNPLKSENPKLLNPEFDYPEKHISFTPDGKVIDLSPKGSESIIAYNLNRDELYVNGRMRIKDEIQLKILKRLERYEDNSRSAKDVLLDILDIIKEDILNPIVNNLQFSQFFKEMLYNFEDFFRIGNPKSAILLRFAFLHIINNL